MVPYSYEGGSPLLTGINLMTLPFIYELASAGKIGRAVLYGKKVVFLHVPTGYEIVLVGDKIYLEPGCEEAFPRFRELVIRLIDRIRGLRISPLVREVILGAIKPANVTVYENHRATTKNSYIIDLVELARTRDVNILRTIYDTLREESEDLARLFALLVRFLSGIVLTD